MAKNINNIPTHELVKELMSREGVGTTYIEPCQTYQVKISGKVQLDGTGSALVLIVID